MFSKQIYIGDNSQPLQRGYYSFQPNISLSHLPELQRVIFSSSFKTAIGHKITIFDQKTGNIIKGIVSAEDFAILDAGTGNVLYRYTALYNEDSSVKGYAIFSVNGTLLEDEKLIYDKKLRKLTILNGG